MNKARYAQVKAQAEARKAKRLSEDHQPGDKLVRFKSADALIAAAQAQSVETTPAKP